jgi:hypothetical protein
MADYFVTPNDFDGDVTTKIQQWIAAGLTGTPAYLPKGNWKPDSPLTVDLSSEPTLGVKFFGDTVARSKIDLTDITTEVPFKVTCSSLWSPDGKGDNFFLKMEDIGFLTNYAGPAVVFGNDDFSDPVNAPEINIQVQNFSTSALAEAVRLNYVVGGKLRLIANIAGSGTALVCRQSGFNILEGSFSAIGGIGIGMKDGYNTGNVFNAPDIENVFCCLRIFNSESVGNTFIGGTWSYSNSGVFATSGSANLLLNPQANSTSTSASFRAYMTGISIIGGNS